MEQSIIEKTVHAIKGRSIFLIGMMGSGKSQTGLKLAELLKYKYIDLDSFIVILLNLSHQNRQILLGLLMNLEKSQSMQLS